MIDDSRNKTPTGAPDELNELRQLLWSEEQERVLRLQKRLQDPELYAEDLSKVLPRAIRLRTSRDKHLTKALEKPVEDVLAASVRRNPTKIVNIILPVIGPAIRRSIARAFKQMIQSLNQTLEYSLSLRSLRWRMEARRSGKTLAEVVLSHTLHYRVEQVFLIHKQTGLLLQHVATETPKSPDADLVSAMLTAIQDFAHDTFGGDDQATLETFEVGEQTVWVEQGPLAVLAAVIRGSAPEELHQIFQDTLETIHVEHRDALVDFAGETGSFEDTREYLEECLQMQLRSENRRPVRWPAYAVAIVILGVSIWQFFSIRERLRWNDYVGQLKSAPGIVVISQERRDGRFHVSGLRDPFSVDPAALLLESQLPAEKVVGSWDFYQASVPEFALRRASEVLQPPPSVTLRIADQTLYASGLAPQEWLSEARKLARVIPGIVVFDDRDVQNEDHVRQQLQDAKRAVEELTFRFGVGVTQLSSDQQEQIGSLVGSLRQLRDLAEGGRRQVRVDVVGNVDASGSETVNRRLGLLRAQGVYSELVSRGIDSGGSFVLGTRLVNLSSDPEERDADPGRTVFFRVVLSDP